MTNSNDNTFNSETNSRNEYHLRSSVSGQFVSSNHPDVFKQDEAHFDKKTILGNQHYALGKQNRK